MERKEVREIAREEAEEQAQEIACEFVAVLKEIHARLEAIESAQKRIDDNARTIECGLCKLQQIADKPKGATVA